MSESCCAGSEWSTSGKGKHKKCVTFNLYNCRFQMNCQGVNPDVIPEQQICCSYWANIFISRVSPDFS